MSERPMSKAELEAYIADEFIPAMRKMLPVINPPPEWQPIETAPRDGTWIMCHCENQGHIVLRFNSNDGWNNFDTYELRPTHWMPLPKPPTA